LSALTLALSYATGMVEGWGLMAAVLLAGVFWLASSAIALLLLILPLLTTPARTCPARLWLTTAALIVLAGGYLLKG